MNNSNSPTVTHKGEIIKEVLQHLLSGDKATCSQIAKEKYPFSVAIADKRNYTPSQMTKVFLRDGFIDRYSNDKLLFPGIFRVLQLELPNVFPAHSNWKMTETHIVYWELFPTIDHVIPIARGGKDSEDNWVTTSMKRNSAKANWLLDEIGWELRSPGNLNDWDGLINIFLDLIKVYPELQKNKYIDTWHKALLREITVL